MKRSIQNFLRNNGLSIAMFSLAALFLVGQGLAGVREYNQEQLEHSRSAVSLLHYLGTGHFIEAVFENWESEFLQMAAFVVLTVALRQKGSSESKEMDGPQPVDRDPRRTRGAEPPPWPVSRGGLVLRVYEHSLTLALALLFVGSFALHAVGGAREYNAEQLAHGGQPVALLAYMGSARFWFESFQNWQSEFLSVGVLVVLSIFLRERGSPQSKPVSAGHGETGDAEVHPIRKSRGRRRRRRQTRR